ncbi:hypothetical protein AB3M89_13520 [Microbacterium sp. 179-I 3D2 NHS]|uniref:hypothetical protein n=1 Tax=Microbacterium sp. 179-I 3D2 NHS TaxID=3235178 RepID=UPI0039A03EEE
MRPRAAVDWKFQHALRRADELNDAVNEYLTRRPVEFLDPHMVGDREYARIHIAEKPPAELFGTLAGEAIHQARAALDHLAWQVVLREGGTPTESTCFPIHDRATGFGDRLRASLPGVSQDVREILREIAPRLGGDERFVTLHRLDIVDKHRMLLSALLGEHGVQINFHSSDNWDGEIVSDTATAYLRLRNPQPLVEGMVVEARHFTPLLDDLDGESGVRSQLETRTTYGVQIEGFTPDDYGALIHEVRDAVEPLMSLLAAEE